MEVADQKQVEIEPVEHEAFEFVQESGGIEEYRHRKNRMRVLLMTDRAAPVVTFMITYHVGSRNEVLGNTGATHLLEHLMFKGTEKFNRRAGTSVFNALQRVGAQVNATTWMDRTNYYELLPREHLALAIEIEADRMRNALLSDEDLESERTVVLNEFDRGESESMRKLYHAVWSTAFFAHPYHHPTIGWRSDIENVTRERLREFYETYYWPNNSTACILGDIDREEALSLVAERFGGIPASPEPVPEMYTREPRQQGERRVVVRQAGQLGAVILGYKSPPALDPDADALDVLAMALTSGKSSRLYRRLTDAGLTTALWASAARFRDPGLFVMYASLSPEGKHEQVEEIIRSVIADVKQDGITQEELTRARNQLHAQAAFGRDGTFAVASQLNEAIAAGDWRLYTEMLERIEAVTLDGVKRAAITYLNDDTLTAGYFIPQNEPQA